MRDEKTGRGGVGDFRGSAEERLGEVLGLRAARKEDGPPAPMEDLFGLTLPEHRELARRVDAGLDAHHSGELLEHIDKALKDVDPASAQDLRVRRRALDLLERAIRQMPVETARWFCLTFPTLSYAGIGNFYRRDVREFWTRLHAERAPLFTSGDPKCRVLVHWLEIVVAAPGRLQDLEVHNKAGRGLPMDAYWCSVLRALDTSVEAFLAHPVLVDETPELGEDEDPLEFETDPIYGTVDHAIDDEEDWDDEEDCNDEEDCDDGGAMTIRPLTAADATRLAFGCPIAEEE
jgi:hypothetical protein